MRSFRRVALVNAAINLMHLVNGVVFIGLLSRLTNVDDFAAWNWLNSAASIVAISDLYLLLYVQNLITRQSTMGRKRFGDYVFRNMFWLQLILAVVIVGAVTIVYATSKSFKIPEQEAGLHLYTIAIAITAQLLSQGLGIYGAYFGGRGDSDISNLMLLGKSIAQNLILIAALISGASFEVGAILFYISGPLILAAIFRQGENKYKPTQFRFSSRRLLWFIAYLWKRAQFRHWATLRVLDAVRNNAPLAMGYFYVNSASLADFIFISRLNGVVVLVASSFFNPMVPRLLAMRVNSQTERLSKVVTASLIISTVFCVLYLLGMLISAEYIASLWAGRPVQMETTLVAIVTIAGLAQLIQTLLWNITLGMDDVAGLLVSSLAGTSLALAMLLLLLDEASVNALPISSLVGATVFSMCAFWMISRSIRPKDKTV